MRSMEMNCRPLLIAWSSRVQAAFSALRLLTTEKGR
jgi:hypothetical protein